MTCDVHYSAALFAVAPRREFSTAEILSHRASMKASEIRPLCLKELIPWFVRILQTVYVILAGFAIEQCAVLWSTALPANPEAKVIYVPLLACSAAEFAQGNLNQDLDSCTPLTLLVQAAAISAICSILGVVAYLVTCVLRHLNKLGDRVLSILTGLAFFLVIALIQAGVALIGISYFCDLFLRQAREYAEVAYGGGGDTGGGGGGNATGAAGNASLPSSVSPPPPSAPSANGTSSAPSPPPLPPPTPLPLPTSSPESVLDALGISVQLLGPHTMIWVAGVFALVTAVATFIDALVRMAVGVPGGEGPKRGRAKTMTGGGGNEQGAFENASYQPYGGNGGGAPSNAVTYPSSVDVQMSSADGGGGSSNAAANENPFFNQKQWPPPE